MHELQMREQELREYLYDNAQPSGHASDAVFQLDLDQSGASDVTTRISGNSRQLSLCSGSMGDSKPAMRSLVKAYLPNKMKTSVSDFSD